MIQRFISLLVCFMLCACVSKQSYSTQGRTSIDVNFDREKAARARLNLALSYLKQNNYQQAKLNLDKALSFAPHLAEVHYSRAYYFQKLGNLTQANEYYRTAFELAPNNPDVQHNYGSFLCARGQFEKAKQLITAAIKSPNYARANRSYVNLAYCSIELGHFSLALNYFELANKHQPGSGDIILMIAGLHYGFANYSKALTWYQKYEEKTVLSAKGILLGVLIYRELELQESELQMKLLALFPDSLEAARLKNDLLSDTEFWLLRERIERSNHSGSKRSEQS